MIIVRMGYAHVLEPNCAIEDLRARDEPQLPRRLVVKNRATDFDRHAVTLKHFWQSPNVRPGPEGQRKLHASTSSLDLGGRVPGTANEDSRAERTL